MSKTEMAEFNRLLITGAAGSLGAQLRGGIGHLCETLRLVDRRPMGHSKQYEELFEGDLNDLDFARLVTKDCDAILHFAGTPKEQSFQEILKDTLPAAYNLYEAGRLNGVKRIVYASSIHAVGYHPVEELPDTNAMHRPDSFYGLSKCFTEDLARLYWDKFGIESVCLRICSCFPEPADRRMLWSWLSFADCIRLVEASLSAQRVGFSIIYGTSNNSERGVSNASAAHIGFSPMDSADVYRAQVVKAHARPDPQANLTRFVGGWFTALGHPDDPKRD